MKILLIGHSIIDHYAGSNQIKPGGVYYSALGFLSCSKPNDRLMLLTGKSAKNFELFEPLYSKVDLSLSDEITDMPEVFLFTSGQSERREVYKNISGKLNVEKIKDISSYDGLMVNMITGFDISFEQLKWIRKNYPGLIYFDVHTLSRGFDKNGKREFRMIPQIEEWLSCIDILQCNQRELQTICSLKNEDESAEWIMKKGVTTLLITKAKNGAVLYSKEERPKKIIVRGENIAVKNKVGCGDIFGASFFYSYIFNRDKRAALSYANHAGAVAASTENLFNCTRISL
ncbi:MAG: carbohydrate kinase family protein [Bacteroidota bacterium]